jgi:hypothetical protein
MPFVTIASLNSVLIGVILHSGAVQIEPTSSNNFISSNTSPLTLSVTQDTSYTNFLYIISSKISK